MTKDDNLQFCATRLERNTLKMLRDIAWKRSIHLKDLLNEVLTDFAEKNAVEVTA